MSGLREAFPELKQRFQIEDTHKYRGADFPERFLSPDISLYDLDANLTKDQPNFRSVEVIGEVKPELGQLFPGENTGETPQTLPNLPETSSQWIGSGSSAANSASVLGNQNFTQASEEVTGQITSYMAAWQVSQHRVHMYSFVVSGRFIQLLRWDRAGAIVSKRLNYVENPRPVLDFFHSLALMDAEELGWDTTVTNATTEEEDRYKKSKFRFAPLTPYLVKFAVNLSDGKRRFVVACACASFLSRSVLGRGTRGHHGVLLGDSTGEDKAVYLKDTWNDVEGEEEHEIYEKLREKGVRSILECYGGGNVVDSAGSVQSTLTQEYFGDRMHKRRHYRIVLEPAIPLSDFKDPYELTGLLIDVLDGEPLESS